MFIQLQSGLHCMFRAVSLCLPVDCVARPNHEAGRSAPVCCLLLCNITLISASCSEARCIAARDVITNLERVIDIVSYFFSDAAYSLTRLVAINLLIPFSMAASEIFSKTRLSLLPSPEHLLPNDIARPSDNVIGTDGASDGRFLYTFLFRRPDLPIVAYSLEPEIWRLLISLQFYWLRRTVFCRFCSIGGPEFY